MSITVLILGILGICLALIPVVGIMGFLPGLVGLILGIIEWQKSPKTVSRDEQFLKTGITLSVLAILFSLAWMALILIIRTNV